MIEEKFLTDGFFHEDVHFAVQELGLRLLRTVNTERQQLCYRISLREVNTVL